MMHDYIHGEAGLFSIAYMMVIFQYDSIDYTGQDNGYDALHSVYTQNEVVVRIIDLVFLYIFYPTWARS